jgi:hypothetical protein
MGFDMLWVNDMSRRLDVVVTLNANVMWACAQWHYPAST